MSVLQVPLSAIAEGGVSIDVETSGEGLRPEGAAGLPLGTVRIQGSVSGEGDSYVFTGRITGAFAGNCDRCLERAETAFDLDAIWVFAQGKAPDPVMYLINDGEPETEEDGLIRSSFEGTTIDLRPVAWEEIVLAAPLKLLCKEDCAGLCPTCGTNLNVSRCDCAQKAGATTFTSRGLESLGDMFPDLKPDRWED